MRLAIILNTNQLETAWNALRLGTTAMDAGHTVKVFLLGSGVDVESIKDETFNVAELLTMFGKSESSLLGCGTCMRMRHREPGVLVKSTMPDLVKLIDESEKVVTFG